MGKKKTPEGTQCPVGERLDQPWCACTTNTRGSSRGRFSKFIETELRHTWRVAEWFITILWTPNKTVRSTAQMLTQERPGEAGNRKRTKPHPREEGNGTKPGDHSSAQRRLQVT
jgi:hypothetical protein